MSLQITPQIQSLFESIYSRGQYADESSLLEAALRLLEQRDALRQDVQQGLTELDRGERLGADEVFADLKARASQLNQKS